MPSAPEPNAPRALAGQAARLALLATIVLAATCCLALRAVRADLKELLAGAGELMMSYPGAPHGGARRLRLNGVDISFRTQVVDERFDEVFEHYRARCDARGIASAATHDETRGYVACLDVGDWPRSLHAAVDRLLRFSETGNLGLLGAVRYVFARAAGNHGEHKTFLLTAWSDSGVDLAAVLPPLGEDAAGGDPVGLPRPAGLQRVLSAFELGGPSGVFLYRAKPDTAGQLSAFYRRRLKSSGWAVLERHPGESLWIDDLEVIAAERDDRLVTVVLRPDDPDTTTLIILTSERV